MSIPSLSACRMCLAVDSRLYTIANTPLQDVYERITDIPLLNGDERLEKVCYLCCHLLRKNQAFIEKSVKADELLKNALVKGVELMEVSMRLKEMSVVCSSFCVSPPKLTDYIPQEQPTDLDAPEYSSAETLFKHEPPDVKVEIEVVENSQVLLNEEQSTRAVETDMKMMHQGACSQDEGLTVHQSVTTPRGDETNGPQTTNNTHTAKKPYLCEYCNQGFSHKNIYTRHLVKHTGKIHHLCSHCDKAFTRISVLEQHILLHTGEKPYRCDHCDKAFNRKSNLKSHQLTHTGEKPYQCSYCDKAFTKKCDLERHFLLHTGETPYRCSYCDKAFTRNCDLERHFLFHTGEKPFRCSHCDKAFNRKIVLERHIRTHTGESPYRCRHCNKTFTQKSHLNEHILIHTGEKPHRCNHCIKAFTKKQTLEQHILNTHRGETTSMQLLREFYQ